MEPSGRYIGNCAIGLVEGAVLAIVPLEFAVFVAAALLCFWIVALLRSQSGRQRIGYLIQCGVAVLAIPIAIALPLKPLDARIGPMNYPAMPLADLCARLYQDWGVHVRVGAGPADDDLRARQVALRTDGPVSKRKMLQKLAHDSGTNLRVGYCGTSENLLNGPYPMLIMLARRAPAGSPSEPARGESGP